ncbi:enoyl-CoA hydratase [Croceifilum oryzae]|uniref:Enoyl-CoA hydratase n=1 Tax=Croceifilum oryzae TaxID=1553429 RepID=A0AAJ1WR45_9BACL|nr:enoyl-CoA hydratase-related protein [Croceifilum oryzae]MDQ0415913.1 enoyl-CoA hydratase [Croceifilum oryzae]
MMETYKHLLVEKSDGTVMVTLNRPKVLNALNVELLEELDQVVTWIQQEESVRAVIITGAGEKAFVAGADITELRQIETSIEAEQKALRGQAIFQKIEDLTKPVIMAINGFALGGGCELAMCGDMILASDQASFGQPEINLGVIPGYGGTQRLARAIGRNHAKYLCMTGDRISAQEAYQLGLVQKVVPAAQLMDEAKRLADQLSKQAPLALHFIKKAIHNGVEVDLKNGLRMEASYFGLTFHSQDRMEGMDAFIEKRRPHFKGN